MENPEEILHSLEEFAKLKPKDIPRELEEYLCFVAKTGDPVYQWSVIKSLFREKLISVITEFYESCPSVDIPPCPNVDLFNYDNMKSFILEKLDTFVAAPFTVQRICELLTTPRKEYNRIDKYMRALEKNILVVSTTEPGNHRTPENGDGFVNGIETEHMQEAYNDINIEEMDDTPAWPPKTTETESVQSTSKNDMVVDTFTTETPTDTEATPNVETVITCCPTEEPYVSIEPVNSDSIKEENVKEDSDVSVTITAIPAAVQKRRDSIEPPSEQSSTDAPPDDAIVVESSNIKEIKSNDEVIEDTKNLEIEESREEKLVTELGDNISETKEIPVEVVEPVEKPVEEKELETVMDEEVNGTIPDLPELNEETDKKDPVIIEEKILKVPEEEKVTTNVKSNEILEDVEKVEDVEKIEETQLAEEVEKEAELDIENSNEKSAEKNIEIETKVEETDTKESSIPTDIKSELKELSEVVEPTEIKPETASEAPIEAPKEDETPMEVDGELNTDTADTVQTETAN